jgi:hypothetical protein
VEELTGREIALFRLLYLGQPQTAGLPLAVLHDRLDLIEPWAAEAVRTPFRPAWDVLHTLLGYYAHVVEASRTADKEAKRRRSVPSARGRRLGARASGRGPRRVGEGERGGLNPEPDELGAVELAVLLQPIRVHQPRGVLVRVLPDRRE